MNSSIPEITGTINLKQTYDRENGNAESIEATWEGGDVVAFSRELLEQADNKWLCRDGEKITVCQFNLEVIADMGRTIYARRCND